MDIAQQIEAVAQQVAANRPCPIAEARARTALATLDTMREKGIRTEPIEPMLLKGTTEEAVRRYVLALDLVSCADGLA